MKRKNRLKDKPELKYSKTVPSHPRDPSSRQLKKAPANIVCDEEFLKEFPYFNKKIRLNETDKIKRREAIFDNILTRMGHENVKYYVKYNQDLDRYYIGKDEKVTVTESSDEEVEQRRKQKRKSKFNIDENNKILKKQIKAKRVIYPTGTLLALTKQKKKTKTKVEIEGDVPSIVPERKKRKRKKKINDNEIIFVKPTKKRKKKSSVTAEQKLEKARKKEEKTRKKKIEKTREKAIKGLIDFNKFIRDDVVEPGQRRLFDFRARNVKQEIINSYRR